MGFSSFCVFLICMVVLPTTAVIINGKYRKLGAKRFQVAKSTSQMASAISCCLTCLRVENCSLVSYHNASRQCELHGFEIGDDSKLQPEIGWDVYYNAEDDCDSQSCQNGGTCQDSIGTYSCTCSSGFEGQNCETDSCPTGWRLEGAACYHVNTNTASWTQARMYCQSFFADLVSIRSDAENNVVINLLSENSLQNSYLWLGAHDVDGTNTFVWTDDGAPVNAGFQLWNSGEPNSLSEGCMATFPTINGLRWNDAPCDIKLQSVCKILL